MKTDDTDQIKAALADLEKEMHAFAQELYKNVNPQAAGQPGPGQPGPGQPSQNGPRNNGNGGDGNVFDAEFSKKD